MIKKILMMKMLMVSSVLFAQDFDGYSHKQDRAHQRLKNHKKKSSYQQHFNEKEISLWAERRNLSMGGKKKSIKKSWMWPGC